MENERYENCCKRGDAMEARIFVIDDTPEILDLFRLILEEEGYQVQLSSTIPENLALFECLRTDLIILDFMLGKYREGWDFLQKLKMFRPTASIPIILCTTALQQIREQEAYLRQKRISVIFKPFDIDDLLCEVKRALTSPLSAERQTGPLMLHFSPDSVHDQ
jgi:DNA-binding response OmpR family regulator